MLDIYDFNDDQIKRLFNGYLSKFNFQFIDLYFKRIKYVMYFNKLDLKGVISRIHDLIFLYGPNGDFQKFGAMGVFGPTLFEALETFLKFLDWCELEHYVKYSHRLSDKLVKMNDTVVWHDLERGVFVKKRIVDKSVIGKDEVSWDSELAKQTLGKWVGCKIKVKIKVKVKLPYAGNFIVNNYEINEIIRQN